MKVIIAALSILSCTLTCISAEPQAEQNDTGLLIKDGRHIFPIGFYELPKDEAGLKAMAQAGVNLLRCHNRTDLDRVGALGMTGWIPLPLQQGDTPALRNKINELKEHPALAVWEGPDEIVWNFTAATNLFDHKKVHKQPHAWDKQTPNAIAYAEEQARTIIPNIRSAVQAIHELDGNKRQIWINEAFRSDLKFVRQYTDYIDIIGCDIYPVRGKEYDVARVGVAVERWKQLGRNQKPVWMVLQALSIHELGSDFKDKKAVYPSFTESRFMAYDVIAHGARGILYWGSHYLKSQAFRQSLYALTSELAQLQPFLVSPDYPGVQVNLIPGRQLDVKYGVRVTVRRAEGDWLIILVNEDKNTYLGMEVTGLEKLNSRTVEELYGTEKFKIERGELITRMKPWEVKIFSTSRNWQTHQRRGRDYQQ